MTNTSGHLGSLSVDEKTVLREFWTLFSQALGDMAAAEQSKIIGSTKSNKTSSSSTSFFGWGSNSTVVVDEVVDGLQATTLSSEPPFSTVEEWTTLFSLGCAYEHPDRLALRFIRARKWDVEKAVDMACAQLKWRREFGVEELLAQGEAKIDLEEIKSGKTYIHGVDKEQRPIVWAHPRLHDKNSVTLELSQNYTILTVETGRLGLKDNVETSTIVFDMNGFGMNNMDYQSVKFLVSCFQTFYPESLGQVLVVDAPWIFNGCWVVIKPWLDPVVASKIKFIPSSALEDHIDKKYIPKCLLSAEDGQEEGYSYQYFPQTDKELAEMKTIRDKTEMHEKMQNGLKSSASDFIKATLTWAEAEEVDENFPACGEKREVAVKAMQEAYKSLVPFIRAKTHYHRAGIVSDPGFTL